MNRPLLLELWKYRGIKVEELKCELNSDVAEYY